MARTLSCYVTEDPRAAQLKEELNRCDLVWSDCTIWCDLVGFGVMWPRPLMMRLQALVNQKGSGILG
jgi:hypothetical protein